MSLIHFVKSRGTRRLRTCLVALVTVLFVVTLRHPSRHDGQRSENSGALVREYIDFGIGRGGRWYIPPTWLEETVNPRDVHHPSDHHRLHSPRTPRTPSEAATLALDLATSQTRFLNNTKIPLIIHQTWKSLESHTWSPLVRDSVDEWLKMAVGDETYDSLPEMAYVMWDDEGVADFMTIYEKPSCNAIDMMPYKVEKADVFRVAVLKWFGGVYADVDTKPLKHPSLWVQEEDIQPWKDPASGSQYSLHEAKAKSYNPPTDRHHQSSDKSEPWAESIPPIYQKIMERDSPSDINVAAIVGLEGDNPPDKDDYWRMGYSYAIQLTNWAMAMAPQHPIASKYLTQVTDQIQNETNLKQTEILDLTGPPAFTKAVKAHCEWDDSTFNWNSISGRANPVNATGKVVAGDVVVLPITGFSPGRGNLWPHKSMGSQPVNHTQARLFHQFAGSWRHKSVKVEYGKFCRTFFGLCRNWSKMP